AAAPSGGEAERGVERRFALSIFRIELAALLSQILDYLVVALFRRPMQGGLATAVGGIDVYARAEQQLDRFDRLSLRLAPAGGVFLFRAQARRGHHGIDAVARRKLRIGAVVQQKTDYLYVTRFGRAQDGSGSRGEHRIVTAVEFGAVRLLLLELRVHVRAFLHQQLHQ